MYKARAHEICVEYLLILLAERERQRSLLELLDGTLGYEMYQLHIGRTDLSYLQLRMVSCIIDPFYKEALQVAMDIGGGCCSVKIVRAGDPGRT